MVPSEIDRFESKDTDVALEVHRFEESLEDRFWVSVGIGALELRTEELLELERLIGSYVREQLTFDTPPSTVRKFFSSVVLITIVGLLVGVGVNV